MKLLDSVLTANYITHHTSATLKLLVIQSFQQQESWTLNPQRTEESWRTWEFQYLISPARCRKCLATSNISLWLSYVGWGALWWMQRRYRVPSQSPLDTELQSWRRYTARCAQPSETKTQPYSESPAVAPGPGTAGTGDEPLYWLVSSRCVWSDE